MADFKKRIDFNLNEDQYKKLLELQEYYKKFFKINFTITDTLNRIIEETFEEKIVNKNHIM